MLIPNQYVEIKWNGNNRKWFTEKGYEFTKYNDTFLVKAEDLMPTSKVKVKVQCDYCGEIFMQNNCDYSKALKKIQKSACNKSKCRGEKNSEISYMENAPSQMQKFFDICEEKGYIPVSTVDDYRGAFGIVEFMCQVHGNKRMTYNNFVHNGCGCNECGRAEIGNKLRTPSDEVKRIVESKNNNELLNPEDYINTTTKNLLIRCGSCGEVSLRSLSSIQNSPNGSCEKCAMEKIGGWNKYNAQEVKRIVESKNNNKLLNPDDYKDVNTKNLLIQCGSCGNVMVRSLASIMSSLNGECDYCVRKKYRGWNKLSPGEVRERIESVNGNKWINQEEYISSLTYNLKIQCGECGEIYTTSLANYEHNDQIRCPNCSGRISKLERRVMEFLDYYCINYVREKKFDDCKDILSLPFDFYLPDYNLAIETDGQGHYEPVFGEESFMRTLLHDGMKNNYCRWNDIDLLRIPYFGGSKIEEILSEKLGIENVGLDELNQKHNRQYFGDHFSQNKIA